MMDENDRNRLLVANSYSSEVFSSALRLAMHMGVGHTIRRDMQTVVFPPPDSDEEMLDRIATRLIRTHKVLEEIHNKIESPKVDA